MAAEKTERNTVTTFMASDGQFDTRAYAKFEYHHLRLVVKHALTLRKLGSPLPAQIQEDLVQPFIDRIAWAEHQSPSIPYRNLPFGL